MKRNLIAALLAAFAGVAVASNSQYNNDAGEQDLHAPQVASSDAYRNDAGEQDQAISIAKNDAYNNDAGQRDEHAPQVG